MNPTQEPKYCIVDENGVVLPNARLAAKMLVTEPSRGEVRASDNLF
jgi:hypothetical protein